MAVDRLLTDAAARGTWWLFAEFVDQVTRELAGDGRSVSWTDDSRALWRPVRRQIIKRMRVLGLQGTVIRTDGREKLEEHDGALAGHVVLHPVGEEPGVPVERVNPFVAAWQSRMYLAHQLTPLPGMEKSLRGFCGQHAPDERRGGLLDHVGTWLDADGQPTLTFEPYGIDYRTTELTALVKRLSALPVTVDGPLPGVWAETASLFIVKGDPHEEVLPAVRLSSVRLPPFDLNKVARLMVAEIGLRAFQMGLPTWRDQKRATAQARLYPLTRESLAGMLTVPLEAQPITRGPGSRCRVETRQRYGYENSLIWLADRLFGHHVAGHLDSEDVERIVRGAIEQCGLDPEEIEEHHDGKPTLLQVTLDLGWSRCTDWLDDHGEWWLYEPMGGVA